MSEGIDGEDLLTGIALVLAALDYIHWGWFWGTVVFFVLIHAGNSKRPNANGRHQT